MPAAIGKPVTDRSRLSGVIIDFPHARRSRHAVRVREEASNDKQTGFRLVDVAVIIYALMATAFYPALGWFLIHS
jgi:hypothetical protein